MNVEVVLGILRGLRLEFDARSSVDVSSTYYQAIRKLTIDLQEASVEEVNINEYELENEVVDAFNRVIRAAIASEFLDEAEKVTPILYSLDFPEMPWVPGTSSP